MLTKNNDMCKIVNYNRGVEIVKWNVDKYEETCGRVTEHGNKLVDILRDFQFKKVLDIGCGTGVLANEINKFATEVIGIDQSVEMIEKAKTLYPKLNFMVMDACSLQWNDYFDLVFSNAVFHFIKSQNELLENIYKVLIENGLLVCEFGAFGNIDNLLKVIEKICMEKGKPYSLRFYYPSEDEYKNLLNINNFSIKSIEVYDLDTQLKEGKNGLRNWVNQIFDIEMNWFNVSEREDVLNKIEETLKITQWDGTNWHLANKRLRVIAQKNKDCELESCTSHNKR